MGESVSEGGNGRVRVATITVSDSRTVADDTGGETLRRHLAGAGFSLAPHRIVKDDPGDVRAAIAAICDEDLADAIVTTGGTGIAPRDQTYEAVSALLEKTLDGFGEAFRRLSWQQVGAKSVLSRAVCGTHRGRIVAALPGSPKALGLAVDDVLAPILEHAVALLQGKSLHGKNQAH